MRDSGAKKMALIRAIPNQIVYDNLKRKCHFWMDDYKYPGLIIENSKNLNLTIGKETAPKQ